MKKYIIFICFFLSCTFLSAQTTKRNLFFSTQAALLNGDQSSNALITAVGGIKYKRWSIGVGAGVDYYKVRSAPIFLSAQYLLFPKKGFFVYADFGANAAWAKEDQHHENSIFWGATPSSFSGGLYSDFGIGTFIDKQQRVFLSAGYSTKTMKESFNELIFFPSPGFPPRITSPRTYEYTFNRIVFKIGIRI